MTLATIPNATFNQHMLLSKLNFDKSIFFGTQHAWRTIRDPWPADLYDRDHTAKAAPVTWATRGQIGTPNPNLQPPATSGSVGLRGELSE